MNPRHAPGTRVRVTNAWYPSGTSYVGQLGVVERYEPIGGEASYIVRLDNGRNIRARRVEVYDGNDVLANEGDTVLIEDVLFTRERAAAINRVGTVTKVTSAYPSRSPTYLVQVGNEEFTAVTVRVVHQSAPTAPPSTAAPTEVQINVKRAQAAQFAHDLLGNDVLLDDVLALAAFVAGEDGQVAPAAIVGDLHITAAPAAEPALTLEKAREIVAEGSGSYNVEKDNTADDDVVNIGGDYLKEEAVRKLVRYLQALLVVVDNDGPDPTKPKASTPPF